MIYLEGFLKEQEINIRNRYLKLHIHNYYPSEHEVLNKSSVIKGVSEAAYVIDDNGDISNCSILRRGVNRHELVTKVMEKKIPSAHLKCKAIYIGGWGEHYGHFLTEYSSRLYAISESPKNYIPVLAGGNLRYFYEIKDYLKINKFIALQQNTSFDEIIIPYPDMSNRCEIFKSHTDIFEKIAKRVYGKRFSKNNLVYLTRSQLTSSTRRVDGETAIEAYISKLGGLVISPEKLSIEEQICLINDAKCIIGCEGSALHNTIFSLKIKNVICFSDPLINSNYFLIEKLKGNNLFLFNCIKRNGPKSSSIDVEMAIRLLSKII